MKELILVTFVFALSACGTGEFSTSIGEESDMSGTNNTNNENNQNNVNNTSDVGTGNNTNNVVEDMGTTEDVAVETGADLGGTEDVAVDTGPEFHPMFIAAADFFLEKCVACHAQGQNGLFVMPQDANATYADVQLAIDDVDAQTGRKIIEPNDPAESQAFIMMTNAAGEQFDAPTIAIVENWINAGAPYLLE